MQRISKRTLSSLLTTVFVVSCTNQVHNIDDGKFSTKSVSGLNPTAIPSSILSKSEIDARLNAKPNLNAPVMEKEINMTSKLEDEKEITFGNPSVDEMDENSTSITVIYHNSHKMRIRNGSKKVLSLNNSNEVDKINTVLDKYKVVNKNTEVKSIDEENKADEDETRISKIFVKSKIPNRQSIHYYDFPKGTDFKSLLRELRSFSSVRSVLVNGILKPDYTSTLLSRNTPSGTGISPSYPNIAPTDPLFTPGSESNDWWYFKRHRIFESWGLYGSTIKPKIAIIDGGLDITATNLDKPTYSNGFSVNVNSSGQLYETQGDVSETDGHGTTMASVAGSQKNDGFGLAGVLPGVIILPIKVSQSGTDRYRCLSRAIDLAANDSSVDVINMSLNDGQSPNNHPLTYIPGIKSSIVNAVSLGKVVVITAGNDERSLDADGIQSLAGVIVVGGSENDTTTNRSIAWQRGYSSSFDPNDGTGSNYGNLVDITAGARILAYNTFNYNYTSTLGTSVAAPMVSVAAGMVKKFASANGNNLTPDQIKSILIGTATIGGYNPGYGPTKSTRYYGKNLNNSSINVNGQANIRDLNIFNALIVARNIGQYEAITRVFNSDDNIQATSGLDWANWYAYEEYKNDAFYGLSGLNGNTLNFRTYNISGGYAFGYQVYKNKQLNNEAFDGLAGIIGANNNAGAPANVFLAPYNFQIKY